jgi:hypothetical protein
MSLTTCAHGCGKLADTESCGLRCKHWPKCGLRCKHWPKCCLWPASPALREGIRTKLRAGAIERDTVTALLAMLETAIRNGQTPDPDATHR